MLPADLAAWVKNRAEEVGFHRCRIAQAEAIGRADYLQAWLSAGRAGTMGYLHQHLKERMDPRELLPGARSVIVTALLYHQPVDGPSTTGPREESAAPARGRVAMYAWGDDYHDVMRTKLAALAEAIRPIAPGPFEFKVCVDTSPLLEREWAAAAGIGWIGKNTMVLDHQLGSYFFLGELLTTLELPADDPLADRCGTCTACLEACPTGAFPAAYQMDPSRCISYLTIEHRGPIDPSFHAAMDDWIFGCDICQEVCPHNRHAPITHEPRLAPRPLGPRPVLEEILGLSDDDYRKQLKGSAIKRAKLDMLKRNAQIAMANIADRPETSRSFSRNCRLS